MHGHQQHQIFKPAAESPCPAAPVAAKPLSMISLNANGIAEVAAAATSKASAAPEITAAISPGETPDHLEAGKSFTGCTGRGRGGLAMHPP